MGTASQTPHLQLPAGLLRFWRKDGGKPAGHREPLEQLLGQAPGTHRVGPGLIATVPLPGDGDILDAAIACGRRLLAEAAKRSDGEDAEMRVLVYPGRVEVQRGTVRLLPDDLTRLLDTQAPAIPAAAIHLTSQAGLTLETPWKLTAGPNLPGPSGGQIPTFRLGTSEVFRAPWRNSQIWGRTVEWIPRPSLEAELAEHARSPALRVTGHFGSGKTRAVLHTSSGALHVAIASPRAGLGPTAFRLLGRCLARLPRRESGLRREGEQLVQKLTADPAGFSAAVARIVMRAAEQFGSPEEPVPVILDNLDRASPADWPLVSALLAAMKPGSPARLVLVGRTGGPWPGAPQDLTALPIVRVHGLDLADSEQLLDRLLPGTNLPEGIQRRLLHATAGNPLILEEGVVNLIQRHQIRRFYGALVFRGGEETDFAPSQRLTALAEGEVQRLGNPFALRLLALAEGAVPQREIRAAASLSAERLESDWERPLLEGGWLRSVDSPWGTGVACASEGQAAIWRETLAPASRASLRRSLGELLSGLEGGEGLWRAYRLLAGDPEAIPVLLRTTEVASKGGPTNLSPDEVVDALRTELDHHRTRRGDPDTELRLLWRLLPLARHAGRLSEFTTDLDRALRLAVGDPRRTVAFRVLRAEIDHDEGNFKEAELTLREALRHAESITEPQKALLLVQLGHALMRQERYREAAGLFESILPTLASSGLRALAATCHFHLGNIALAESRLDAALEHHQRALATRRSAKTPKPLTSSLSALGAVYLAQGRYTRALTVYQEAERVARQSGDEGELGFALRGVGRTLTLLGDFTAATGPLRRGLELRERGEDVMGEAVARLEVAENYLYLNKPVEALAEARKALFRLNLLGPSATLGEAERLLGRIQAHRRRLDEARRYFRAAIDHQMQYDDPTAAAYTRASLIQVELTRNAQDGWVSLVRELAEFLESSPYPELGERLDLAMYRALNHLKEPVEWAREPLFYLQRAYEKLMQKTAHLPPELRNRFLLQIPDHQAIVTAATQQGLAVKTMV